MKPSVTTIHLAALAVSAFALAACGPTGPQTGDGETHWAKHPQALQPCTSDATCGGDGLRCLCGVCTTPCHPDTAMRSCQTLAPQAACVGGEALAARCPGTSPPTAGVCLDAPPGPAPVAPIGVSDGALGGKPVGVERPAVPYPATPVLRPPPTPGPPDAPDADPGCGVDSDHDGLDDCHEEQVGTNPQRHDSDGDGLGDLAELHAGTDPLRADSDGDGLGDADELRLEYDPLAPQSCSDGVLDGDRWLVGACRQVVTEAVDYHTSGAGDWKLALPGAMSPGYRELRLRGQWGPVAAAIYGDDANEIGAFALSLPLDPQAVDATSALAQLHAALELALPLEPLRQGAVATFQTHDFHQAATSHFELRPVGRNPQSSTAIRDEVLRALAPFGAEALGEGTGEGAAHPTFRLLLTAVMRRTAGEERLIVLGALAPQHALERRGAARHRLEDLTNTTLLGEPQDTVRPVCEPYRAPQNRPEVDFYWVLDQTASMQEHYERLGSAASEMFALLHNGPLDWRVATTPMDLAWGGRPTLGWHTESALFGDELHGILAGGHDCCREHGLEVARRGVSWLRDPATDPSLRQREQARLVTFFVSDEETFSLQATKSAACTGGQATRGSCAHTAVGKGLVAQDYSDFLRERQVIAHALVGDGRACGESDGEAYRQVAQATGGVSVSLCEAPLQETLQHVVYATSGRLSPFALPEVPVSSTLRLYKDGAWVPRSRDNGFDYFPEDNTVALFGAYRGQLANPALGVCGEDLVVHYETFVDRTKN